MATRFQVDQRPDKPNTPQQKPPRGMLYTLTLLEVDNQSHELESNRAAIMLQT